MLEGLVSKMWRAWQGGRWHLMPENQSKMAFAAHASAGHKGRPEAS
jgi:hypothetical protein